MNAQLLEQARAAYRAGEYSTAAQMFAASKRPDEVSGEIDHLRGNSLMHLGLYADAAKAYTAALGDTAYGKRGALLTNQGKALAASGDLDGAVSCFNAATQDVTYATPYKAYVGLGSILRKSGRFAEAGTAFRQAAIDGANPAPASALAELGECFIELGRPEDAVESFRTALDYVGPRDDPHSINAALGQALSLSGRPADALDAFNRATSDGLYQLTDDQQNELAHVHDALDAASARTAITATNPAAPSADDDHEDVSVDPLDPLGKSGQFMPDPSDTGFFTLSESDLIQQDRKDQKVRRRRRHTGLKVFVVILVLLVILLGGGGFCYTQGFGVPSQESVINDLFIAVNEGNTDKAKDCLAPALSDDAKTSLINSIPAGSTVKITGLDKSMSESTAVCEVSYSKGSSQKYTVKLVRSANHIGWAVASVDFSFADTSSATASSAADQSNESSDAT